MAKCRVGGFASLRPTTRCSGRVEADGTTGVARTVKCFAAATLSGLKITEGGRGIRIGRGMSITSEPGSLKFATTGAFCDLAGIVGRDAYLNSDAVVHALADIPYDERLLAADQFIAVFLRWVNEFLMALWAGEG